MGYLIFGIVWIPSTDLVLANTFESQQVPTIIGLVKGWTFIGISTVLIYSLTSFHQRQMKYAQTKLETSNQELQVLHRVLRHNIRNDLNVVLGYTERVCNRILDEEAESTLATVHQRANKIIQLSDKLRVIDNVDPSPSTHQAVNVVELLSDEIETIQQKCPEVTIDANMPDKAWVQADDSLRYAFREICENAIEHNDKKSAERELSVGVERSNEDVVVTLSDNGPGIPSEELDAFRNEEETPLVHASGIGLWIALWVIRLHGGTIQFSETGGTTVSILLQSEPEIFLMDTDSVFDNQWISTAFL